MLPETPFRPAFATPTDGRNDRPRQIDELLPDAAGTDANIPAELAIRSAQVR